MDIGFIGLGKMGLNMVKRILTGGHIVYAYDINREAVNDAEKAGANSADSVSDLITKLPEKKIIWVMVPSGDITKKTIEDLGSKLKEGDTIIDGGNSNFNNTIELSNELKKRGIILLDAGTSGGIWGLEKGYCLMVGGESEAFTRIEPVLRTLAPPEGYLHTGPSGSGHFVKMVHNGIEYAMLQAYAEGFELLKAKDDFRLDLKEISNLWNQGSVIRSWLLELAERSLSRDPSLEKIKGYVEDSGEGRWTVETAIDLDVPAPTITQALFERFRSRQESSFANKMIAALRDEFGGHGTRKTDK